MGPAHPVHLHGHGFFLVHQGINILVDNFIKNLFYDFRLLCLETCAWNQMPFLLSLFAKDIFSESTLGEISNSN